MTHPPQPDAIAVGTIVGKVRWRLLPFLFILYIIAFLDRINIGFAALTMNKELGISAQQFGFGAGIFFLGYSTFEIPSNLLLHKLGARIWIARILIAWGMVSTLTGCVQNAHQLYLGRFLLGLAEAGYFPGIVLYLTYWFRQRDRAQAIGLFMAALPMSSILGAPLSGVILDHVHWLGVSSWRWLLILEGAPAILAGVLTYFLLPSRPAEATFLTDREKDWIITELEQEEQKKGQSISILQALTSGRVWYLAATQFFFAIAMYALTFWLPQVIKALSGSYSNTAVGMLVMLPFAIAAVTMVIIARHSDRHLERRYHCAIPMLFAGGALIFSGHSYTLIPSLILLSIAAAGTYGSLGPFWTIPSGFLSGYSAASGIALVNAIANLGGFVGPYMIGTISKHVTHLQSGLVAAGASILLAGILILLLAGKVSGVDREYEQIAS